MNRFFSLLLLASGSVAFGQSVPDFELLYESDSTRFFKSSNGMLCWTEAQAYAEQFGGHLATFHDEAEYNQVYELLSPEEPQLWIGLVQDEAGQEPSGGWRWVTGEALAFEAWAGGEPNQNVGFPEDYGVIRVSHGGWNDIEICAGEGTLGCIIELPLTAPNPNANVPDYVPADGLLAWYGFNGNANDLSGNDKHGTVNGAILTEDRFGMENSAYHFANVFPTYIQLPEIDETIGDPGVATTMSIWSRSDQISPGGVMIHCQTNPINTHIVSRIEEIQASNRIKIYHRCPDQNDEPVSEESFEGGAWNHFVVIMDGEHGEYKLYVNGVLWQSMSFAYNQNHDYSSFPRLWQIGTITWDNVHQWAGDIDDVGIFGRALSEQEVIALYSGEAPAMGCTEEDACNYDPNAHLNDNSCEHFTCKCLEGTVWSEELGGCIVAEPAYLNEPGEAAVLNPCYFDSDDDGLVNVSDLMNLLTVYNLTCGDTPETIASWQCGDPLGYQGYDYATVQIGEQCWFAESLRSENYRNGDAIPANLSDGDWVSANGGACSIYGSGDSNCDSEVPEFDACNEEQSLEKFGRLYNWYAVADERGLCPEGWKIPSDNDWMVMEMFLGIPEFELNLKGGRGIDEAFGLKSVDGWSAQAGDNSLGLSVKPTGARDQSNGRYYGAGWVSYIWSSSQNGSQSWYRFFTNGNDMIGREDASHPDGLAVRCLKDAE